MFESKVATEWKINVPRANWNIQYGSGVIRDDRKLIGYFEVPDSEQIGE